MQYKNDGKSIYFYENSEVFINKFNVRNQEVLTNIETDITMNRLAELCVDPIKGRFSLTHLLRIHEYIFADLYPFAGKTRNENISKGTTPFCGCEYIHENFSQLYTQLKRENYLKKLNIIDFSERISFYMSEINIIHPFREGNGRAIREYIRCLALKNGYVMNWKFVDKSSLLKAMILSVNKNYAALADCIYNSLEK